MNQDHSSAFVSPNGMVDTSQYEVITTLNSTNAELAGFESIEESSFSLTKANADAITIPTSNAHLSEARDHQQIARVPNSAPQCHVLPTWTRKAREATNTPATLVEQLVGKKKKSEVEAEGRQSNLPSKCQKILQGDNDDFIEVVEAVNQLR